MNRFVLGVLLALCAATAFGDTPRSGAGTQVAYRQCSSGNECFYVMVGSDGRELVRVSFKDGKVTVTDRKQLDAAAQAFWQAVQSAFPGCK